MNRRTTKRATLKRTQPEFEDQQQSHRPKQNTTRSKITKQPKQTTKIKITLPVTSTIRKPQSKNTPTQKIKSTKKTSTTRTIKTRMGFCTRQEARRFTHVRSETEIFILISYPCRISMMRELRVYTYWSKDR
jgi:hypothetical protein